MCVRTDAFEIESRRELRIVLMPIFAAVAMLLMLLTGFGMMQGMAPFGSLLAGGLAHALSPPRGDPADLSGYGPSSGPAPPVVEDAAG